MSENKRWVRITQAENIPLREGRSVKVDGWEVAIFNLGDRFLAVEGRCPHKGGPLAEGIVTGNTVVCPLHAWKINLETGAVANQNTVPACVRTFRTRVESNIVSIELPQPSSEEERERTFCSEPGWSAANGASLPSPPL
jgi:nitrite reductase (NADH) small subunit